MSWSNSFAFKKKNKYSAKKVSSSGFSFSSKLERAVFEMLKLLEKAGEITDIKCQVSVYLTEAKILFKPDFRYTDVKSGEYIYCEAKGFSTPVYMIKRRLWKFYGPGPLIVYKGNYSNPYLDETIIPKKK